MTGVDVLEIRVRGSLLLGGGSWGGLHETSLRDAEGRPYLPASAVKGALREQMQRLVGPETTYRVFGQSEADALEAAGLSDDSEGRGEAQADFEHKGGLRGGVFLSDAVLAQEDARRFEEGHGFQVRTQVGIQRKRRGAMPQHLYQREIVGGSSESLTFHASLDARQLDEEGRRALRGAVRSVFALGASKSTGMGQVEMEWIRTATEAEAKQGTKASATPAADLDVPEGENLIVILRAEDPLCLGLDRFVGNLHESFEHIPASALRGAVATAGLRQRGLADRDQSGEAWFRKLFLDPATSLRFESAWPVEEDIGSAPCVPPLSLRTCKVAGTAHGVRDRLILDFLHRRLAEAAHHVGLGSTCGHPLDGSDPDGGNSDCSERLVRVPRPVAASDATRRLVTRLALDPRSATGRDGQLFSIELLERGTRFAARVSGVDADGREFIADAAFHGLRVGRGRGQGYGRIAIENILPDPGAGPLRQRLERFDGWVRSRLHSLRDLVDEPDGTYFSVSLASDLVPPNAATGTAEDAFLAALDLPGRTVAVHAEVRAGQRGGWNSLHGGPKALRAVVQAGSVLLVRTDLALEELLPALRQLESRGAGRATEEGFGTIRISDPIHDPDGGSHDT